MASDSQLADTINSNILAFAQFLASQPDADSLKAQFDKAYFEARYEVKRLAKCGQRWMRVSECPQMREYYG